MNNLNVGSRPIGPAAMPPMTARQIERVWHLKVEIFDALDRRWHGSGPSDQNSVADFSDESWAVSLDIFLATFVATHPEPGDLDPDEDGHAVLAHRCYQLYRLAEFERTGVELTRGMTEAELDEARKRYVIRDQWLLPAPAIATAEKP